MEINTVDLMASLGFMWKGMLGLFVCMGFIALVTVLLNKIMQKKKEQCYTNEQ